MNESSLHQYSSLFYRYQREGSLRSARRTLSIVTSLLKARSVLDVGCGAGAWLAAYRELGLKDMLGVDGDYVDRSILLVDESCFRPQDITQPFDLGRRFDLVQCLEVAEHIPPGFSSALVASIVRHGDLVLFSAGVPGQGGENHINEQPMTFWRDRFSEHGLRLFDFVRPRIIQDTQIESWYRYNLMFFAHDRVVKLLPREVIDARVADGAPIPDLAPLPFRVRKALLRSLPVPAVTALARWKHRWTVQALARSRV